MTTTAESNMATRQPEAEKLSARTYSTALAAMAPPGMPRFARDTQNARFFRRAPNSASRDDAPPNSPPKPIPWMIRRTMRRIGAAMPNVS